MFNANLVTARSLGKHSLPCRFRTGCLDECGPALRVGEKAVGIRSKLEQAVTQMGIHRSGAQRSGRQGLVVIIAPHRVLLQLKGVWRFVDFPVSHGAFRLRPEVNAFAPPIPQVGESVADPLPSLRSEATGGDSHEFSRGLCDRRMERLSISRPISASRRLTISSLSHCPAKNLAELSSQPIAVVGGGKVLPIFRNRLFRIAYIGPFTILLQHLHNRFRRQILAKGLV